MSYTNIPLTSSQWTMIGNNVSTITFQNSGQSYVYINITSTNTAPTDTVGLIYPQLTGELKKLLTDMTGITSPAYVWAKAATSTGSVIVGS